MSKKNHLLEFRVENFKRFEKLHLKNLGEFNLIIGDNNVGKTSLLEALLYSEDSDEFSKNLLAALNFKNIGGWYEEGHLSFFVNKHALLESSTSPVMLRINYINQKTRKDRNHKINDFMDGSYFEYTKEGNFIVKKINGDDDSFYNGNAVLKSNKPDSLPNDYVCPLIPFSLTYGKDLSDMYSKHIIRDRVAKRRLLNLLAILIPDIEDIEFDTVISNYSVLVVALKGQNSVVPLANFGDGATKLFRLLMYLIIFKGQRLMVDEIDTGIHYSRMKDFWRVILSAAEENEVQLFVTTHNQECIRYFKEVLEEKEMEHLQKEARTITLVENAKTKDVEALTSGFEELDYSLTVGNEVR